VGQRSTEQNLAAVSRHFSFPALADLRRKKLPALSDCSDIEVAGFSYWLLQHQLKVRYREIFSKAKYSLYKRKRFNRFRISYQIEHIKKYRPRTWFLYLFISSWSGHLYVN
jgi:hypothetical protein